ncbi:hypothetical protein [Amphibacillus sediminis]|nr:hypothetical protein [Amphibacillus sediminis]
MSVKLKAEIVGVSQAGAEELVEQADQACPYSRTIEGNVKVKKTAVVK